MSALSPPSPRGVGAGAGGRGSGWGLGVEGGGEERWLPDDTNKLSQTFYLPDTASGLVLPPGVYHGVDQETKASRENKNTSRLPPRCRETPLSRVKMEALIMAQCCGINAPEGSSVRNSLLQTCFRRLKGPNHRH